MVEIHKVVLPFRAWALVTGVAFVICIGFAVAQQEPDSPDEPTVIEEPSE